MGLYLFLENERSFPNPNPESESAYHVRILRYLRLCARKMGFLLLLRLCTERKKFFWFFSQMSSRSTTLSLQHELLNRHERFFSQWYSNIKFWHFSQQPYEHSHWLFGAYHFAFENLSWKFVFAGFDGLWIRIYSQKIDIPISKMADRNLRN